MNMDMDEIANEDNYVQMMSSSEITILRYITFLLYMILLGNVILLCGVTVHFIFTPCENCDYYPRVLVLVILVKSLIHSIFSIYKIKKRDEIEENDRLKRFTIFLTRVFNLCTLILTALCLYILHFNKNKCSNPTIALQLLRYFYILTITVYFVPLLLYIFIGLFLSIIICIVIYFSVEESERIPTPEDIISKLEISKYKNLDYVHKKNGRNGGGNNYIKKPSFEMIFGKVKSVMKEKDQVGKQKKGNVSENNSMSFSKMEHINSIEDSSNDIMKPLNESRDLESYGIALENTRRINNSPSGNGKSQISNNQRNRTTSREDKAENEEVCSICMMNYINSDDVMIMPCDKRHFFHVSCVTKWLYKSQVCPICRTNIVQHFNNMDRAV